MAASHSGGPLLVHTVVGSREEPTGTCALEHSSADPNGRPPPGRSNVLTDSGRSRSDPWPWLA